MEPLMFEVRYRPNAAGDPDAIGVLVTFAHAPDSPTKVALDTSP